MVSKYFPPLTQNNSVPASERSVTMPVVLKELRLIYCRISCSHVRASISSDDF
jgi:hypothetical protein